LSKPDAEANGFSIHVVSTMLNYQIYYKVINSPIIITQAADECHFNAVQFKILLQRNYCKCKTVSYEKIS